MLTQYGICVLQAKEDAAEHQERSKAMKGEIKEQEELEKRLSEERDACLMQIGNLVHDSVPVSADEVSTTSLKTCTTPKEISTPHTGSHTSVLATLTERQRCCEDCRGAKYGGKAI